MALAAMPGMPKLPVPAARRRSRRGRVADAPEGTGAAPRAPAEAKPAGCQGQCRIFAARRATGHRGRAGSGRAGGRRRRIRRCCGASPRSASSSPRDLGYLLPPVRVTDNLSLRSREYVISAQGRRNLPLSNCRRAASWPFPPVTAERQSKGQPTREPAFGMSALWIPSERAERARNAGYTVVDSVSVLGTHLSEVDPPPCPRTVFAPGCQAAARPGQRWSIPKVVEDLVPKLLPLATVQRVLQNLLRERVSIRDAVSILEALGEAASSTRNPVLLTEYVRQALRRTVVKPYLTRAGELPAWFLDPVDRAGGRSGGRARRAEQPSHAGAADTARHSESRFRPGRLAGNAGGGHHFHGRTLLPAPDYGIVACPTCSSWRTTKCRPDCACRSLGTFNERGYRNPHDTDDRCT